ncbi:MAG: DegV family protein [Mycobacteriales bacterium]
MTDSTASLPRGVAAMLGISVVPLKVHVGQQAVDEDRLPKGALDQAFREHVNVTTSPPEPPAFYWAYQDALNRGAEAIVSIHLSAKLSETCESAREAARQLRAPVSVVDSHWIAMACGYPVMAAAQLARRGAGVDEVVAAATARCEATDAVFCVDSLDYLRRGGRIGGAAALVGNALDLKPLLTMRDGGIVAMDKVRKASRAMTRLEDFVAERAGRQLADVAVHHVCAPQRAAELSQRLRRRLPRLGECHVTEASAVLGAHGGPGVLGVVVSPRPGAPAPPPPTRHRAAPRSTRPAPPAPSAPSAPAAPNWGGPGIPPPPDTGDYPPGQHPFFDPR